MARMKSSQELEDAVQSAASSRDYAVLRNIGWVSAGITALALGVVIGRELRQRYKFSRRTPYDFYAHSGDQSSMEFGVGI
jgi:hypothetical protein